jgi:hypothetical protein
MVITAVTWSSDWKLVKYFWLQNTVGDLIGRGFFFLSVVQQHEPYLGSLIAEFSRSQTIKHTPYLVWPPWTSDHPVAETANYTIHKRRKSTSSVLFEPAIPAIEGPQTYDFDRATTRSGNGWFTNTKWMRFNTFTVFLRSIRFSALSLSFLSFYRCTFCLTCFSRTSMTFHLL